MNAGAAVSVVLTWLHSMQKFCLIIVLESITMSQADVPGTVPLL